MNSHLRFLVVNTSVLAQFDMAGLLTSIGYPLVDRVTGAKKAMRIVRSAALTQKPIKLLIAECAGAFSDCIQLIQSLTSLPEMKEVPILLVSEEATPENVLSVREGFENTYIVKPANAVNFIRLLDQVKL
ncbi:hypothetical protein ACO0LO_15200 [Undibacterium sp. TJN25]|uniref:hypothetical protein n=1 Tax=Undibacterium sp. TJN25 TaxID=3413056 RepID=UPI003BEF577A